MTRTQQPITSALDDDGVEMRWLEPYTGALPRANERTCQIRPMYHQYTPPTSPICTLHPYHDSFHAHISNSGIVLALWAREVVILDESDNEEDFWGD